MHLLLRTAKAKTAGKSKSFHFTPDFCTEKRSYSQFLPEKEMEKEMNIQNLRSDTEETGEEMVQATTWRKPNPLRYLGCCRSGGALRLL